MSENTKGGDAIVNFTTLESLRPVNWAANKIITRAIKFVSIEPSLTKNKAVSPPETDAINCEVIKIAIINDSIKYKTFEAAPLLKRTIRASNTTLIVAGIKLKMAVSI